MSTHLPVIKYPGILDTNWRRYCRNGQPANGTLARRVADATNHVLAYRRKVWGTKCVPIAGIPTGLSGDNPLWFFAGHTGHGLKELEASIILARADNASAADPYVYLQATPLAGGSAIDSTAFHFATVDATPDDYPSEFAYGTVKLTGLTANTSYVMDLRAVDYARVVACTVYEVGLSPVDTAAGAVDPRVHSGVNILDNQIAALLPAQTNLWKHNAGCVLQWTRDSLALAPSTTSTTYNNIIDASTTVSASTAGLRVNLAHHNTQSQAAVPVMMIVKAHRIAGGDGAVRITDGTNSIEITGIDDVTGWYSTTGTMPATDGQKWDIQHKAGTIGTHRTDAVYVFEYLA